MSQLASPRSASRRRHLARSTRQVREICAEADSTAELIDGLRGPLADALGSAGMIVGGTDPRTVMFATGTLVDHLPQSMAAPWMHNEVLEDDVNKFAALHRSGLGATTLHRATQGNPGLSPRHALHRRAGFGPELRVTFSSGPDCWGVAVVLREAADPDFSDIEVDWLDQLRSDISDGLRRTAAQELPPPGHQATGVVTLDFAGRVTSVSAGARALLEDMWMCPVEGLEFTLPGEAYMVATVARAVGGERLGGRRASTRLRGRSGRWITIRGECMYTTDGTPSDIGLVIEQSRPAEVLPLLLASYGYTRREREVLAEMAGGRTAREIADRLFISEHTVRDHVKSILAKSGSCSRGELISLLFQHHA